MPETDKLNKDELVTFRMGTMDDAPFIFSTWLKGLRFGNDWYGLIESKAYFEVQHKLIEQILSKPNVTVRVACLKDEPNVILGYAVYAGSRVDWIHIKKSWRGIGLVKDLLPNNITTVSHLTAVGRTMMKKRGNLTFNPFNFD